MIVNKGISNWLHFRKRIHERYQINLNKTEYDQLSSQIAAGEMRKYFVRDQSLSKRVYRVPIKGTMVMLIYSKQQHNIVTVLPKWTA